MGPRYHPRLSRTRRRRLQSTNQCSRVRYRILLRLRSATPGRNKLAAKCIVTGCQKPTLLHVHLAWNRRIIQEEHCCADHVEGFLNGYNATHIVGEGTPQQFTGGVVFDVEMLLYDDRPDKACQVSLREIGGTRRLDIGVGIFEVSALRWQLERLDAPRPLTHAVIASVINALDGQLEYVAIDKFVPNQPVAFEAKLHIRRGRDSRVVDVRPSDAFTLAVICDAPIVVLQDVLKNI
jgi:bifunctional DNase/RNase